MNKWLSDTVDYYWQIAKLESWHWGLVIYNQRVTWAEFAILAIFSHGYDPPPSPFLLNNVKKLQDWYRSASLIREQKMAPIWCISQSKWITHLSIYKYFPFDQISHHCHCLHFSGIRKYLTFFCLSLTQTFLWTPCRFILI